MNNSDDDNPWINFLSFAEDSDNCPKDKDIESKDKTQYRYCYPGNFRRSLDLLLCKKCNILVTKFKFIEHCKNHNDPNHSYIPYYCNSKDPEPTKTTKKNTNKKVVKKKNTSKLNKVQSKEIKNSKVKKLQSKEIISKLNQVKSEEIFQDHKELEFIPKTIVNEAHPLKLKIQLAPKMKEVRPPIISEKVEIDKVQVGNVKVGNVQVGNVKVGNVKDGNVKVGNVKIDKVQVGNVKDGDVKVGNVKVGDGKMDNGQVNNVEMKQSSTRSLNEFLKQYEKPVKSDIQSIKSESISNNFSNDAYQKVQSIDNSSKYRKTVVLKSNKKLLLNENNNFIAPRNIAPSLPNKAMLNTQNYSMTFQPQKPESVINLNKSIKIFQNTSNGNHIRLNGQRKYVRIQNINDPASSNLILTGEKLTSNPLPSSSSITIYNNHSSSMSSSSLMPDGYSCNDFLPLQPQLQQSPYQQPVQQQQHYEQYAPFIDKPCSIKNPSRIKLRTDTVSTQKQFQRRLIQNGIISESDITRCETQKSLTSQSTNDNVLYATNVNMTNSYNNNNNIINGNNSANNYQYINSINRFSEISTPKVTPNKRKIPRKSTSASRDNKITVKHNFNPSNGRLKLNSDNIALQSTSSGIASGSGQMKPFYTPIYTKTSHPIIHQPSNIFQPKNKVNTAQLSYPVIKPQVYQQVYSNPSRSSYISSQPPNITISSPSSLPLSTSSYQNNNNHNILAVNVNNVPEENIYTCHATPPPPRLSSPYYVNTGNNNHTNYTNTRFVPNIMDNIHNMSTIEFSEEDLLLDNNPDQYQISEPIYSTNSNDSFENMGNVNMEFAEKEPIENLHYLPTSSHRTVYHANRSTVTTGNVVYQQMYNTNKISNASSYIIPHDSTRCIPQTQTPQQFVNTHNVSQIPSMSSNISTNQFHTNDNLNDSCPQESTSNGENRQLDSTKNTTRNEKEILSSDSADSGIHILASPGKKISHLPWDMF